MLPFTCFGLGKPIFAQTTSLYHKSVKIQLEKTCPVCTLVLGWLSSLPFSLYRQLACSTKLKFHRPLFIEHENQTRA
ncbi:hypothetical protein ElyMa_001258300 [Elysia marginata]|uniref:Uncharacterized protein n=1 Tax=Elysia marginata TaxID=1093978 RepID=A0AAV4ID12_9GAST|nr:hypothetical protein ElyMa_001258300 [Elysia marginata]